MTTTPGLEPPISAEPELSSGQALNQYELARTASMVMLAFVLSGILGMVRQIVLTAIFGADAELDAFYAALRVPETLFVLVAGGALGSAFIPVFSGFLSDHELEKAWRLASSVMTLVVIAALVGMVIGFVFATPIVENLLVPDAKPATQALTVDLMRVMLLTVALFGVSGLIMGILNAHQRFLASALAPSMYNVGIIVGALVFGDVWGLAWGAVLGASLHLAVQLPALRQLPHLQLRLLPSWNTEGVGTVLKLMGPRLLGLAVIQVNFWVNIALASAMAEGSLTALSIAFTLMFTVLGVLGQSVGTTVFPTLARHYAEQNFAAFRQTLHRTLETVLFLCVPAGFGMAVLARPIVTVLFQRGEWTSTDTQATAWALLFYGIGLMGHAALEILARTYYALHDTWTPVLIGGSAMFLNVILSFAFVALFEVLGADTFPKGSFAGLALANSLATALESTTLWFLLGRKIVNIESQPLLNNFGRTFVASLGMTLIVWLWLQLGMPLLIEFGGGLLLGGLSFAGLALVLRIPTAQTLRDAILGQLRR